MNAHPIPANANLLDLVELNRLWEREDALAALEADLAAVWPQRRAMRPKGQQIYRERAARAHRERMASATAFKRPLVEMKGERE